jgi:glycosyltransferase involved in cell wall biosynthesis
MADLLVLTPRFPYPIEAGDTLRIYHLCRELANEHSLTLLSLCNSQDALRQQPTDDVFDRVERVYHPTWKAWYETAKAFLKGEPLQLGYFRSQEFAARIDDLIPSHDLVLAHFTRTGQYVEQRRDVPTVLEMTDAFSLNYQRVASLGQWSLKELLYRIEAPLAYSYEQNTVHHFDLVSLVSEVDRDFLLDDGRAADQVQVYTNGIDLVTRPFSPPASEPNMVFIGNMRTVHNRASCDFFIEEVLPLVREEIPEATFKIVGAASSSVRDAYEDHPGVHVTGWVDSIAEATQDAFSGIGVMRVGCGLQNKILEYMALGVPVVANRIGIEGINLTPGENACLAETPAEIAALLVDLYRNEERRNEVARRARRFVEQHHSWNTALAPFVKDVNAVLQQ